MKKFLIMSAEVAIGMCLMVAVGVSMSACSSTRGASTAPSAVEAAKMEHIATMLQNRLYKVDFTRAYPVSGRAFTLNYPYFVSIIGDRVESFLPYFGRAYLLPVGGGEGLRFTAPTRNYEMTIDKRGRYQISFDARTSEDDYTFELEVDRMGRSSLTVYAQKKQAISFGGEVDPDPEFEAVRLE